MNNASQDLPHHVGLLREQIQHPSDFERAMFYFLEEFAGDAVFIQQSLPADVPHLAMIVAHVATKALGNDAQLGQARVFHVPEHRFYHGSAPVADMVALFLYFEDLDMGIVAFMMIGGGNTQVARFRMNGALRGGIPTRN